MKRRISLIIGLLMMTLFISAQDAMSNSEINEQWRHKTISVKNGGQAPGVLTLLKAFYAVFPSFPISEVLAQNEHPLKGTKRIGKKLVWDSDDDTGSRIVIDPVNGYVENSTYTDAPQMSSCVWRRSNGHRLFAVSIFEQHEIPQHLLCWYDYDPKTQTMKPERTPLDDYEKPEGAELVSWELPQKGTDFKILNLFLGAPDVICVYHWDGMHHQFSKSLVTDFKFQRFCEGDFQYASQLGFTEYASSSLLPNGYPMIWLRSPAIEGKSSKMMIFQEYRTNMQTVGIDDETHTFEGFKRVTPEQGEPWTKDHVLAVTKDSRGDEYYAVYQEDYVSYYVIKSKSDGIRKIGFGGNKESPRIIDAHVAEKIEPELVWRKFEFTAPKEE